MGIAFATGIKKVHEKGKNNLFHELGGPNRDRTDDLTDANRTLSQLSYRPLCF